MSRRRFHVPGAVYHVTDRGNRREVLFRHPSDWSLWLRHLDEAHAAYGLEVLTYCGMPNHTHLLVRSSGASLSDGVWCLKSGFARDLKARYGIEGAVFERRFYAKPVVTDEHFLEAMRYIALNPVRARLVSRPEDYERSGHATLMGRVSPPRALLVDQALERMGGRAAYARAVEERLEQDEERAALALRALEDRRRWSSSVDAREVHRLVEIEGMSKTAAARALGVHRATVDRALDRWPA